MKLPAFFIDFLTEPGDLVLDIFAGSNTTGFAAEVARRRWLAFEQGHQYLAASILRFLDKNVSDEQAKAFYMHVLDFQETVHIEQGKFEVEGDQTEEVMNIQPSLFEV